MDTKIETKSKDFNLRISFGQISDQTVLCQILFASKMSKLESTKDLLDELRLLFIFILEQRYIQLYNQWEVLNSISQNTSISYQLVGEFKQNILPNIPLFCCCSVPMIPWIESLGECDLIKFPAKTPTTTQ